MMRPAETEARGSIIDMKVAIITDMRIWTRYCMKAMSAPTSISPDSTRCAPNQKTATVEALKMTMTMGKASAISRPTASAVPV